MSTSTTEHAEQLSAAFDNAGVRFKDRAESLAKFKEKHEITYDEDGQPFAFYDGERQPLRLALGKFATLADSRELVDGRSLRHSDKDGERLPVASKEELNGWKEKSEFITKFGLPAYEKLPLKSSAEKEVIYLEDFYALPRQEKVRRINADKDILRKLRPRPSGQVGGTFVNHSALEKQKQIRPSGFR